MNENEIIKALACCCDDKQACKECPYVGNGCICGNENSLHKDALDLINRQKAEIAELQSELIITKNNFDNAKDRCEEAIKIGQKMNEKLVDAYKKMQTAKSEARKEFAERLCEGRVSNDPVVIAAKVELAEMESVTDTNVGSKAEKGR